MNSTNTWILSYPRSGNHLVRYLVEVMTKRSTLGCIDNERDDTPICRRPNIEYLDEVLCENPVARKSHDASDIKNASNLLLVLRNPIDTIISHHFKQDAIQVSNKNNAKFGAAIFLKNLKFYASFSGKKAIVKYEDLVSDSYEKALTTIADMFDIKNETLIFTLKNYDLYRADSLKSPHRKPQTVDALGKQSLSRREEFKSKFSETYASLILDISALLQNEIIAKQYSQQLI